MSDGQLKIRNDFVGSTAISGQEASAFDALASSVLGFQAWPVMLIKAARSLVTMQMDVDREDYSGVWAISLFRRRE